MAFVQKVKRQARLHDRHSRRSPTACARAAATARRPRLGIRRTGAGYASAASERTKTPKQAASHHAKQKKERRLHVEGKEEKR